MHADTTTSLPITSFGRIVADTTHGHLFLSSPGQNEILVTDLAGQQLAAITGQDGVLGMALSPDGSTLYAALPAGHAVTAIDMATLQQTASYPLGSGNTPRDVAVQSGKVWVSYDNGTAGGAVGDIDVAAASPAFQTQAAMGGWYSAPDLAADPQDTGVLIAAQPGESPSTVASYNVSADPAIATVKPTFFQNCDFENDVAVAPGGSGFTLACGAPYNHYRYSTADLSQQGSYASTAYPDAVAFDANGEAAAGSFEWYSPDLYIYDPSGNTRLNTYDLGGSNTDITLAARGLAWAPDGSQLFAVLETPTAANPSVYTYSLGLIDKPTFRKSVLSLTGPASSGITKPVTLKGSLTLGGVAPPAGTAVTVTRTVSGGADQTFSLTTAADGSYTLTDTPPALGQYTYTASYSGDSNTASATATQTVNVTLIPSSLTMTGPSTAGITQTVTLTGTLTVDGTAPPAGTTVTVTRTVTGGADKTFDLTTAADGSYTLTDTPPALGQYTYAASYGGDANTASATAAQTVNVTLIPTSLTMSTGSTAYTYQPTIKVTAHLGTTHSNRTVSIYAQPAGGSKKLLKTGTVDASGNLAVSYTAPHNTTFSAVFTGDQDYAPVTVTQNVYVRAKVSESVSGYYGTTSVGGTTYHLYHHTALLKASAIVTPNKSGECVRFEVQEYYQGAWQANVTTGCRSLNSSSKASATFGLTQADLGYHYRVRASYPGDLTNAGNHSGWQYLIVRK